MVKIKRVQLEDNVPSSLHHNSTIRQCLWSMVEYIHKKESHSIKNLTIDTHEESNDEQQHDSELQLLNMPLTFGSKKKRKRSIEKENQKKKIEKIFSLNQMPKCKDSFPREHNLFHHNFYFCQVIGVGINIYHAMIRYIGNSEIYNVTWSELNKIPEDYIDAAYSSLSEDLVDLFPPSGVHQKYWDQRYRLLSKYDLGVMLDEESWYSITPEIIADYVARRCVLCYDLQDSSTNNMIKKFADCHVLDLFCGCGGNIIAMTKYCKFGFGVDIDDFKTKACQHNASIYETSHKLNVITMDAYNLLRRFESNNIHPISETAKHIRFDETPSNEDEIEINDKKEVNSDSVINLSTNNSLYPIDVILLCPPWGGPEYNQVDVFDLTSMIPSGDGMKLVQLASKICTNMIYIVPKNTPKKQLEDIAKLIGCKVCIEDIFLHGRLKLRIAYYGDILSRKVSIE